MILPNENTGQRLLNPVKMECALLVILMYLDKGEIFLTFWGRPWTWLRLLNRSFITKYTRHVPSTDMNFLVKKPKK